LAQPCVLLTCGSCRGERAGVPDEDELVSLVAGFCGAVPHRVDEAGAFEE